jgi:cytochrome c oxidase subunit II
MTRTSMRGFLRLLKAIRRTGLLRSKAPCNDGGGERFCEAPEEPKQPWTKKFANAMSIGILSFFLPSFLWADYPRPWQMYYQNPVTPVMEHLYDFHITLLIIEGIIVSIVAALLIFVVIRFRASRNVAPSKTAHNTLLEIIWTTIPVLVLVFIAFPSFKILYMMDVTPKAQLTIKATGNQWYWTYEYPDHDIRFDSNIVPEDQLKPGQLRLFEVDNRVVVPTNTNIRVITTSADVVHSWAVPAFGVKRDSVPGRLNETWFNVKKEGVYYGQCSELCGVKHGFMPIVVEAVSPAQFEQWLVSKKTPPQTHSGG